MVGCFLSQLKPSGFSILSYKRGFGLDLFTGKNVEFFELYPTAILVAQSVLSMIRCTMLYRIKPEELYILSCGKGIGRRARPFLQLGI